MSVLRGVAVWALASLALSAGPVALAASGEDSQDSSPAWVIAEPRLAPSKGSDASGGGQFYATGPVDEGTLVVIPNDDGSLPGGITKADLDAWAAGDLSQSDIRDRSYFAGPAATTTDAVFLDVVPMATGRSYVAPPLAWSPVYTGSSIWG